MTKKSIEKIKKNTKKIYNSLQKRVIKEETEETSMGPTELTQ